MFAFVVQIIEYTTPDGRRYRVREIQEVDREHLLLGLGKMSPTTRYQRFHQERTNFSDLELDFLVACDGINHVAYVCRALDQDDIEGEGIAVARFYRDAENGKWGEVAIVVIDAWQDAGIGALLLDTLAAHCRRIGIEGWRAVIVGDNQRAINLFSRIGAVVKQGWEDRSLVLSIRLNPT